MGTNRARMRAIWDHFDIVSDMRVVIAPVNGCFTSGLTTLLDVLQTAEGMRRSLNAEIPSIDVEIGGLSDTVVTRNGLTASVSRRLDREGCADVDVLVVPSLGAGASAEALEDALRREDINWLADVLRDGPLPPVVAAACSGTFVLAQGGLTHELVQPAGAEARLLRALLRIGRSGVQQLVSHVTEPRPGA